MGYGTGVGGWVRGGSGWLVLLGFDVSPARVTKAVVRVVCVRVEGEPIPTATPRSLPP